MNQTDPDATVVTALSQRKTNPKLILLVAGIAVVGVLLGLVGMYLYMRNDPQPAVAVASPRSSPTPTMSDRARQVEEKILSNATLSDGDITGLSPSELRVLRNVHFARYGRSYDSPGLGDYFSTRSWYKPSADYNDGMITANDKANINLILSAEKSANGGSEVVSKLDSTRATNENSGHDYGAVAPAPAVTSATSSGGLTNSNVESAILQLVSNLRLDGSISVEGIQEVPQQNAAVADVSFSNFKYGRNFHQQPVSISQYKQGAGRKTGSYWKDTYNETMKPQTATYSGRGNAVLKRYNDGRWVLKEVRWGNGFDGLGWNGTVEVR